MQHEALSVSPTTGIAIPFDCRGARGKNQKAELPAVFKNAEFVYVQAYNGDALNPHVIPDDRDAIYNVEQGLKAWNRYGSYTIAIRLTWCFWFARGGSPA